MRGTASFQGAKSVNTVSSVILSSNDTRSFIRIENTSDANPVYGRFGSAATADANSFIVRPGASIEFSADKFIDTRELNMIATGDPVNCFVLEG